MANTAQEKLDAKREKEYNKKHKRMYRRSVGDVVFDVLNYIFFTVFVFEYYNAEYEYSYVNGSLTIDKIMAKSVRKNVGSFDLTRATLVAKVNSQEALGKARQQLRTYNCSSGVDDPEDIVIYTYDNDSNEMIRLFMLPDDSMKEAIISAVGNGVAHL